MNSIIKFFGRLLFVYFLISSTFLYVTKPEDYTQSFSNNYTYLVQCVNQYVQGLPSLPATTDINWTLWVQIYGTFQGLIALLILIGDGLGGFLLFVSLIVFNSSKFCGIQSLLQWDVERQLQLARFVLLLGVSVVLMSTSGSKKAKK